MKHMVMIGLKVASEQLPKLIKDEFDLETNHEWYTARMENGLQSFLHDVEIG